MVLSDRNSFPTGFYSSGSLTQVVEETEIKTTKMDPRFHLEEMALHDPYPRDR